MTIRTVGEAEKPTFSFPLPAPIISQIIPKFPQVFIDKDFDMWFIRGNTLYHYSEQPCQCRGWVPVDKSAFDKLHTLYPLLYDPSIRTFYTLKYDTKETFYLSGSPFGKYWCPCGELPKILFSVFVNDFYRFVFYKQIEHDDLVVEIGVTP